MKGSRVQAVVQELRGEKIDIIAYDPDPARYVVNGLAPAEISRVVVDEVNQTMEVIVADEMLSLAIGRRGQNVRLASKLTGWKIDVKSESKYGESLRAGYRSLLDVVGVSDIGADTLYQAGYGSAEALAEADAGEMATLPGIDEERALGLIDTARKYMADRAAGVGLGQEQEEDNGADEQAAQSEEAAEAAGPAEDEATGEASDEAATEAAEPQADEAAPADEAVAEQVKGAED
jgi:N utilization substance protein A